MTARLLLLLLLLSATASSPCAGNAPKRNPQRYPDTTDARHPEGIFMLTSPDGVTWTEANPRPGTYTVASSAAWNGRFWLTVGDNTGREQIDTMHVLTSPDGLNWSFSSRLGGATSVAWTGSQFVVVGGDRSSSILTSPDGINWTARNSGTDKRLHSVAWTGEKLVAVGEDNVSLTSRDGVNWTLSPMKVWGDYPRKLIWTGSRLFSLQQYFGSIEAEIISSVDGKKWDEMVLWKWEWPPMGLVWTGRQFVAVGMRGCIWTSPDGKNWTRRKSGTRSDLYSVAWTGKLLVTAGLGGDILTSPDGITWTARRKPLPEKTSVFETMNFVTYGNGQILILGERDYLR